MSTAIAAGQASQAAVVDPELTLRVPEVDVTDPELSIVIPALDEELTIGEFVDWCHEGLRKAGVVGEVLIVNSSEDRTGQIAYEHGARVLSTPRRGLGRAYIDALLFVRGSYVLMGDADCTYDFRELAPFVDRLRDGNEFVMGSRWLGYIEDGAMPWHHRYLGTPFTTWILNVLYSSEFSDIHCGMRGISTDALRRMNLQSQSWEYASEMVLKSVHMELRTAEVPVRFLKDPEGRESHHKREGWLSPFKAAWINLRAMFVYGSDFFVFRPGIVLASIGLLIVLLVSTGDVDLGPITLSLNWQFLGVAMLVVGLQGFFLGCIGKVLFDYTGRQTRRWLAVFPYTRSALISFGMFVLGCGLALPLFISYFQNDLKLNPTATAGNHLALTGLALVISAVQLFIFTLLLHGTVAATGDARTRSPGASPDESPPRNR